MAELIGGEANFFGKLIRAHLKLHHNIFKSYCMFKSKLKFLIWALLPSILVSQTILEANAHGNFLGVLGMYISPDKEQMVALG